MTTVAETTAAQQAAQSAADKSRTKLAENFDMFLNLLTTQLKNQDPLSPMDSTEFTNQLVQFANVEQQIAANANLEKLAAIQQTGLMSMSLGYLGKEVDYAGEVFALQEGKGGFTYHLAEDAHFVSIAITDADGNTVRTMIGEKDAGPHAVEWDGTDDSGQLVEDGVYKIKVDALDRDKESIETFIVPRGTVTGVTNDAGTITLSVGDIDVPFNSIHSIRPPATSQTVQ